MSYLRWFIYFFAEAFQNIRSNLVTSVVTIVTIAISLSLCGLFTGIFVNLNSMLSSMSSQIQVTAYMREGLSEDAILSIKNEIVSMSEVEGLEYISKERAFATFKDDLRGQKVLLEGLSANPFPASYEIKVKQAFRTSTGVKGLVSKMKRIDGIEDIQYGQEVIDRFFAFIRFVEAFSFMIGGFLLIATVFIVSNTIRLAVYSRREEIEIMGLIGATSAFIKTPFFIEGIVEGFSGAVLSIGILSLIRSMLIQKTPPAFASLVDLPVSAIYFSLGLVMTGVFLGMVGSIISFRRFLKN